MRRTRSCLLCFFYNPYISPFNSHNFLFTWLCSFFTCLHSSWSFAPPKKWLFSVVTWGIKCMLHMHMGMYVGQLRNFCRVYICIKYSWPNVWRESSFHRFPVLSFHGSEDQRSRYRCRWEFCPPYLQPDPEEEHCDFVKTTLMNISHILHHISSNFF